MSQFIKFFFHFFYAQHVSDINTSIIRSLRLFYCITTLVVCSVKMEVFSISVNCKLINCDIKLVCYSSTITMMHGPIYIRISNWFVVSREPVK